MPTLLIRPDADNGVFPSQAAEIFDAVAATDKQFLSMPGRHYFENAGQRDDGADTLVAWLRARGSTPAS